MRGLCSLRTKRTTKTRLPQRDTDAAASQNLIPYRSHSLLRSQHRYTCLTSASRTLTCIDKQRKGRRDRLVRQNVAVAVRHQRCQCCLAISKIATSARKGEPTSKACNRTLPPTRWNDVLRLNGRGGSSSDGDDKKYCFNELQCTTCNGVECRNL